MRTAVLLGLLTGCSDYKFTAKEFGSLAIDPPAIETEAACGFTEHTVSLQSVGEFAVKVRSLSVRGIGWTILDAPSLPVTLEPGRSVEVVLVGSEGDATLEVASDDPDGLLRRVPLVGTPNEAPQIVWVSPSPDAVLEAGTTLSVEVVDPDGSTDGLVVDWHSSVDGPAGLAYVEADGSSSIEWAASAPGDHLLTATVTDSCGAPATATLGVCQQDGYVSDSLDLTSWELSGDARYDETDGWVELTDATDRFQLGSAFQTTTTRGNDVKLTFSFFVSGGTGADGFALTALDMDRATGYVAQAGGCLGYGGGGLCGAFDPLFGWNVEIDTFYNADLDPTAQDHLSFHFDGDVAGYEAWAELPEMEDGSWHDMTVEVAAPRVTISIDGVPYIDEDIEGHYDFPAEVGFTASTGGETNFHLIDGLRVIEQVCDEE